jgi:two-component system OmpR family sensor kinase
MRRLQRSRLLARLPVRWRLGLASAILTLAILVAFAFVVGRLTTDRIRHDFNDELKNAAHAIAGETTVGISNGQVVLNTGTSPEQFAIANDAVIRIVDRSGNPIAATSHNVDFGSPVPGISDSGGLRVATVPVANASPLPVFVQYARSSEGTDETIKRLWLFLVAGVLGGTLLAGLAGLAIADRAMRPIAALTATAREIAATRDTSKKIPEPATDDEIAELARTLAAMLRALDEANEEREHALQRQREFVADASHELRTPLTSVLANLELLSEELDRDSEAAEIVASALGSSQRMRRLVSDLLLLARADAGHVLARTPVDLAEIASSAVDEVRPMANGHPLASRIDGPLPMEGNGDDLHRLVVNLLDNAVRHTPPGAKVELEAKRSNGDLELSVSDEGPGLPAGKEDQVFERFVRGEGPADVAGHGGTGLGLAIVKAVADAHGGSVSAGRSPSGGALFTVKIPSAT